MAGDLPTNAHVAGRLQMIGDLLEMEGAVRHRVLAYRRAAARIRATPESVASMAMEGRATDLPDIGATLQAKIRELCETGDIAALAALRARIPEGVAAIARLEGIGPKRAVALWGELGVADLDALAAAVADGRVGGLPGFGPATQARIADQLAAPSRARARARAHPAGHGAAGGRGGRRRPARRRPGRAVEVAGSLRRGRESVHDIDLVGTADRPADLLDALVGRRWWSRSSRAEGPGWRSRPTPARGSSWPWGRGPRSATCSSTPPARPRTTCGCASSPCGGGCRCPSTASPDPTGPRPTPTRTACMRRWACTRSRPSCARTPARSTRRWRAPSPPL